MTKDLIYGESAKEVLNFKSCECTFCIPSKLQTEFKWFVDPPFQLSPENGQLKPGEECRVTVEFKPQQALVYQAEACCAFGDDGENSCTVLLRGLCEFTEFFK